MREILSMGSVSLTTSLRYASENRITTSMKMSAQFYRNRQIS